MFRLYWNRQTIVFRQRLVFDDDFKSFDKYIKKRTQVKIFNSKVLWDKAIHDFDVKVLVPC